MVTKPFIMKVFTRSNSLLLGILLVIACKNTPTTTADTSTKNTAPAHTDIPAPTNQFCYLMVQDRDSTFVTIKMDGDKVTGSMEWNPYQQHGAIGTLSGIKNTAGELALVYRYTIEGSEQSEAKVMKMDNEKK